MSLRATLAALLAGTALGCASLRIPAPALEGWHVVESAGIRIAGDASAEEIRSLASDLAAFDAAFEHLTGARLDPSATLYFLRSPALGKLFGLRGMVAGWAYWTLEDAFACIALLANPIETRAVLFHEYTHLLLATNRRAPLPRWYNEGLAVYFSTLGHRDGALVVGAVPLERLQWLASRGAMPLDRLFAASPSRRYDETLDYYATSWALAHYLIGTPDGRRELSRFTAALSRGVAPDEARRLAFGRPLDRIAEELSAHVGYLQRGAAAEMVLDPSRIEVAIAPEPRPLAAAEVAAELGSLALALGAGSGQTSHLSTARALLRIALERNPSDVRARAALAQARALQGTDQARLEIGQALAAAPRDPEVRLRAGEIALATGAVVEAQAHFQRALDVAPLSPAAWFGLGRTLAGAGHSGEALAALRRARELGWSDALDLELGRLQLAAGHRDEAFALLWPLAQDPHRGSAGEAADTLLRDAGLDPDAIEVDR